MKSKQIMKISFFNTPPPQKKECTKSIITHFLIRKLNKKYLLDKKVMGNPLGPFSCYVLQVKFLCTSLKIKKVFQKVFSFKHYNYINNISQYTLGINIYIDFYFQNKSFGLLTRLKEQVNYNQLDAKERIDYDIFNNTLTMIVEGNNWKE